MNAPHQFATGVIKRTHVTDAQHASGVHEGVHILQREHRFRYRSTIREIERSRLKLIVRDRRCSHIQPDHAPAFMQQRIGNSETDA